MTKEECKQVVLDIIAEIAPDEDLSEVKPEVRLRDQLDLDSMDFLDIVMELRKQHGIEVPEEDYPPTGDFGQLRGIPHAQIQRQRSGRRLALSPVYPHFSKLRSA